MNSRIGKQYAKEENKGRVVAIVGGRSFGKMALVRVLEKMGVKVVRKSDTPQNLKGKNL